jgi:hypothetical protein
MLLASASNGPEVSMNRFPLVAAVALITLAPAASAQPQGRHHWNQWHGGWRVIGHKTVNGASDSDLIRTPGARRFSHLRLCAFVAPLRMRDFDVYFANGGHQDVRTREVIGAGSCTRAIDLKGGARDISHIRLSYQRIQRGMRAPQVQVSAR